VPARHPRIRVPRDPELDRAITRAQGLLGSATPASRVVHDLALRGLTSLEDEAASSDVGRDFLVAVADGTSGLDLDALRTVRDRAWR